MHRCKGITNDGNQCKRNMLKTNYCKQHVSQKNISKIYSLPRQIITYICQYLNPKEKMELSISCKHFYNILKKNKIIDFNLYPYYGENIKKYIINNNLNFSIKNIKGDGNCAIYTIYEFLKNKIKNISTKKIQKVIKRHIDNKYENQKWVEILDVVKTLDYFGFGVIFKIINLHDFFYLGYNIKDNYNDVCFINYISELHFELLITNKN